MTDWLIRNQKRYLADQMNKVSRSFALISPEIEVPLRDYLSTAYLICRVADNIEDCTQPYSWSNGRVAEFVDLLNEPAKAPTILGFWEQENWPGLTVAEQRLMGGYDGKRLWQIYSQIPETYRKSIQIWAGEMAEGMLNAGTPAETESYTWRHEIRLTRLLVDYNQYCFYVAGTVGHMITEMANRFYGINGSLGDQLLADSEICGRALQKTNIIKDFVKDLDRGYCYLPDEWLREVNYSPLLQDGAPIEWKNKVLRDVLGELDASVDYVVNYPSSFMDFRLAGLLMMLPAYETLLLAAHKRHVLFTAKHHVKISRPKMAQCLLKAKAIVNDNHAIRDYTSGISRAIGDILAGDQ